MNWKLIPFALLKVEFFDQTEFSMVVSTGDSHTLKKEGFVVQYYSATFEYADPYTKFRYVTPPKEVLKEMFNMIDSGQMKIVGTNCYGTYYDGPVRLQEMFCVNIDEVTKQTTIDFNKKKVEMTKDRRILNLKNAWRKGVAETKRRKDRRKIKALGLAEDGYSIKTIANLMSVTVSTVNTYLR